MLLGLFGKFGLAFNAVKKSPGMPVHTARVSTPLTAGTVCCAALADTVTVAFAVRPPSFVLTVMVAVPAATPVTTPAASTRAILELLELQVTPWLLAFDGLIVLAMVRVAPVESVKDVGDMLTPVVATLAADGAVVEMKALLITD